MVDPSIVSIPTSRLAHLRDAVLRAVEGDFDAALRALAAAPVDEFGGLERAVRELVADYRLAIDQNAMSIAEFTASQHELLAKLETIEQQHAAIQRLSAPIIDVWDGVVTVPLAGVLDADGARELTARLLAVIHRARIAWVIVDLTGATHLDVAVAQHILRLSRAVALMGARCLVTGVAPQVAHSIVALGVSAEDLRPMASLKEALKLCM